MGLNNLEAKYETIRQDNFDLKKQFREEKLKELRKSEKYKEYQKKYKESNKYKKYQRDCNKSPFKKYDEENETGEVKICKEAYIRIEKEKPKDLNYLRTLTLDSLNEFFDKKRITEYEGKKKIIKIDKLTAKEESMILKANFRLKLLDILIEIDNENKRR